MVIINRCHVGGILNMDLRQPYCHMNSFHTAWDGPAGYAIYVGENLLKTKYVNIRALSLFCGYPSTSFNLTSCGLPEDESRAPDLLYPHKRVLFLKNGDTNAITVLHGSMVRCWRTLLRLAAILAQPVHFHGEDRLGDSSKKQPKAANARAIFHTYGQDNLKLHRRSEGMEIEMRACGCVRTYVRASVGDASRGPKGMPRMGRNASGPESVEEHPASSESFGDKTHQEPSGSLKRANLVYQLIATETSDRSPHGAALLIQTQDMSLR